MTIGIIRMSRMGNILPWNLAPELHHLEPFSPNFPSALSTCLSPRERRILSWYPETPFLIPKSDPILCSVLLQTLMSSLDLLKPRYKFEFSILCVCFKFLKQPEQLAFIEHLLRARHYSCTIHLLTKIYPLPGPVRGMGAVIISILQMGKQIQI